MPYIDLTQHEKRALLVNTCLTSSLMTMVENSVGKAADEVINRTVQHIVKFVQRCDDKQIDKAMELLQESIHDGEKSEFIILDLTNEFNNASNN